MENNEVKLSRFETIMRSVIQRYNHEKYWKYRRIVVNPEMGSKIGDWLRLYYIKRADAFNNASMGTHRNIGAAFAEPPHLPHGLNGIIISHNAVIGRNCTIFHQVTIGEGKGGAPVIGDIEGIYAFGEEYQMPVQATTYMYPPVRINGCQYGCSPARFTAEEAAAYMLKCREQYMTPERLRKSSAAVMDEDSDCVCAEEGEHMRCRAGRTAFWVTWDGRMLPCGMFPDDGYRIADMGFNAAWEAVKRYTQTIRMPKECTNCPSKDRCCACAASVIAETGDSTVRPDYICRMTKTLRDLTIEKYGKAEE